MSLIRFRDDTSRPGLRSVHTPCKKNGNDDVRGTVTHPGKNDDGEHVSGMRPREMMGARHRAGARLPRAVV